MIKDVLLVNRHHTQDRDLEESSLPYYIQDKSLLRCGVRSPCGFAIFCPWAKFPMQR